MLTSDERFEIGMKFLKRLKPATAQVKSGGSQARQKPAPLQHFEADLKAVSSGSEADRVEQLSEDGDTDLVLTVPEVLAETGPLPAHAVILGMCEDGLPFLFDLTNPAPGSLLIVGDSGSGKARLVKSILASARHLSKPDQLTFSIISPNASEYQDEMLAVEYCRHFVSPREASAARLIENLAQQAEKRRRSTASDQMIILVVDDLAACWQSLDDEQFRRFYWLIKHGPRSRIWVVATFEPASLEWLDARILDAFRTRVMGAITDPELAAGLAGDERFDPGNLEAGSQFCVPFGDEWIRFWVCDPA